MSRINSKQPITAPLKKDAPAQAAPTAATAPQAGIGTDQLSLNARPATVTIARGDTLSAIAERVLGDPNRWEELFEANRDRIKDPHRLQIGLELRVPGASAPASPPATTDAQICPYVPGDIMKRDVLEALDEVRQHMQEPEVTYKVKRGDSLSRIAAKMLGDAGRWQEILEANRDVLQRPEGLQPGMVLKMPDGAKEILKPTAPDLGEEGPVQTGQLWELAREFGEKYDLDPRLIMAVVQKESSGNPRARSPVGARGLMQLMPGTARDLGVRDPYNARQNMDGGSRYLKQLIRDFGDVRLALMAYNWGPGNVRSYVRGRKKPPRETRNYVPAVLAFYRQFGGRA